MNQGVFLTAKLNINQCLFENKRGGNGGSFDILGKNGGNGGKKPAISGAPILPVSVSLFTINCLTGGKLLAMRNTALRANLAGMVSLVNKPTILLVP